MFKVGDILKGNNNCDNQLYRFGLLKGKVLELLSDGSSILIEILEHSNPDKVGFCFMDVNSSDFFELFVDDVSKLRLEDINDLLSTSNKNEINSLQNRLDSLIEDKDCTRRKLAHLIKEAEDVRCRIEQLKIPSTHQSDMANKIFEELNLIQQDEKCTKVTISDKLINIFTKQLYIEDDEYPEGHFKMNEYKIVINLGDLVVKVFGLLDEYNRKSCWSDECPHPHISHSGSPCWGNTEAMLVDSMSNKELYTTFMLVINYLETFNIDDTAGKNIKNWDFVSKDDNNKILDNPYMNRVRTLDCGCEVEIEDEDDDINYCEICADSLCNDCYYTCGECGDYFCSDHRRYLVEYDIDICDACLDRYYVYSDDTDDYIRQEDAFYCEECDCYCHTDKSNTITTADSVTITLCDDCLEENYCKCDECGEYIHQDDKYYICGEDIFVCESCKDSEFEYINNIGEYVRCTDTFECEICNGIFSNDSDYNEITRNDNYSITCCNECKEKYPYVCECCYENIESGKEVYINHEEVYVCSSCKEDYYVLAKDLNDFILEDDSFTCDICEDIFSNDSLNAFEDEDGILMDCCNKCYENVNTESCND